MPDSVFSSAPISGSPNEAPAAQPALSARCFRCGADLSGMPRTGRYCPRCGFDTLASAPAAWREADEAASPPLGHGIDWDELFGSPDSVEGAPALPPAIPSPETRSEILAGYSTALYKLGRRYEMGAGAGKNTREAIRCYLKAARLGNLRAFARLATRWTDAH